MVLPPKSDRNSQEVLPVSGTQISIKRVSVSLRAHKQKSPKSCRLTDRQLTDRQIWDTLIGMNPILLLGLPDLEY